MSKFTPSDTARPTPQLRPAPIRIATSHAGLRGTARIRLPADLTQLLLPFTARPPLNRVGHECADLLLFPAQKTAHLGMVGMPDVPASQASMDAPNQSA